MHVLLEGTNERWNQRGSFPTSPNDLRGRDQQQEHWLKMFCKVLTCHMLWPSPCTQTRQQEDCRLGANAVWNEA